MNVGICVCVLLAALSSGSLSLPSPSVRAEGKPPAADSLQPSPSLNHTRQTRSAPAPPSGQFSSYSQDVDGPHRLSQLLARIISRKGSPFQARSSLSSRSSGLPPSHRITDRDYMGWMDFGRRSAEEYEYSS
ncbi:cholecystokinin-like [Salarias fasciatus]|uniref:Cholecystokinin-like n=1 Tax=Salarias fasciatus TaxID=181472 RepID=A0A672GBG3_SALFA|nr:cholecystokinin-like [Salarias fasciatus]